MKRKIKLKADSIRNYREAIIRNRNLPKKELIEFTELFDPIPLLLKKKKEFLNDFEINKKSKREKGFLFAKYFQEYGYFSYGVLDRYLSELLNVKRLDPSAIWMSRKTNKQIRRIDLEIEKMFDKTFNYSKFKRYVTCNYCVDHVYYSEYNINSYNDNMLYLNNKRLK